MKKINRSGSKTCVIQYLDSKNSRKMSTPSVQVTREPKQIKKLLKPSTATLNLIKNEMTEADKFATPEINSTLRYAQAIIELENLHLSKNRINSLSDLTLYEQNIIQKRLSSRIDFPPDVPIYKDLIPLEIPSNEIIEKIQINSKPKKVKFSKKDITPILSDFYMPKKKGEYKVLVDSPVVSEPPIRTYNGLHVHRKMSCWEIDSDAIL